MTKTPASDTVKELPGYPVQNSPSENYSWGGAVGRLEIVYDIVWMGCLRRTLRAAYTCMLVSCRRLSPQFQCSLSAVSLHAVSISMVPHSCKLRYKYCTHMCGHLYSICINLTIYFPVLIQHTNAWWFLYLHNHTASVTQMASCITVCQASGNWIEEPTH
jgi:hypothetical protein